jgi:hypothetical protein
MRDGPLQVGQRYLDERYGDKFLILGVSKVRVMYECLNGPNKGVKYFTPREHMDVLTNRCYCPQIPDDWQFSCHWGSEWGMDFRWYPTWYWEKNHRCLHLWWGYLGWER